MRHLGIRHGMCPATWTKATEQTSRAKIDMHIMHPQIGVILFNMLCGPSLFRAAIVAAGESRRRGFQDTDPRTVTKCVSDPFRIVCKT